MTKQEIAENKIQLEALEAKFDKCIAEINRLNNIIASGPEIKQANFLTIKDMSHMSGLNRKTIENDIVKGRLKVVYRGNRKFVSQQAADEYLNP